MEERREVAKAYLVKAREHLEAAEISLQHGLYRDAISRAYYAVYSAAYSILFLLGKTPKTHAGVRTAFGLLVKEGIVEDKYGKVLTKLHGMREISDYDPFSFYGKEEAEMAVKEAKEFIKRMEDLLSSLSKRYRSPDHPLEHEGEEHEYQEGRQGC